MKSELQELILLKKNLTVILIYFGWFFSFLHMHQVTVDKIEELFNLNLNYSKSNKAIDLKFLGNG